MKNYKYLLISFFIFLMSCDQDNNQSKIIIETTGFADSTKIYLQDIEKQTTIDSGYIINNKLVFSVEVDEPTQFLIKPVITKRWDIDYKLFWKENKLLMIKAEKGNLKNARVEGSEIQKQADILEDSKAQLEQKNDSLQTVFRSLPEEDAEKRLAIRTERKEIKQAISEIEIKYVKNNPEYLFGTLILTYLMRHIPKEQTKELYENLSPEVQLSKYGITVKKYLELSRDFNIGDKVLDFQLPDLNGNLVGLNDFENKYILLEFWASGCGPCRMENPNLLKNYKAYKDRGFEIVSISVDKKRENWENAVKKDSMKWTTVSDLKGFEGDVAITYSLYFIPKNYLIDPNGVIIAENLRGEQLGKKLKEIFPI